MHGHIRQDAASRYGQLGTLAVLDKGCQVVEYPRVHVIEEAVLQHGFQIARDVQEDTPLQVDRVVESRLGGQRRGIVGSNVSTDHLRQDQDEPVEKQKVGYRQGFEHKVQQPIEGVLICRRVRV